MPGLIEDARRTGGLGIDLTRDAYWCYEGGEYRRFASGLEGLLLSRPLLEGIVREEATGHSRWFERLLGELGFELWIGDPAEIKAKRVKKQKFDREDARLLLRLLRENNIPQIWVPDSENRDLRQLLWHCHRLVQVRTRIKN